VTKTATVFTNDPHNSQIQLKVEGNVRQLISFKPASAVFRGMRTDTLETEFDVVGEQPFHITGIESNIEDKVAYKTETVEDGKHYKVKITNKAGEGTYMGFVKLLTDLPQKSELMIRVNGSIEGAVTIRPHVVLVGKYGAEQPIRSAKVEVKSPNGQTFNITGLAYDEKLLTVTQRELMPATVYELEIEPKLEALPPGGRQQANVLVKTDLSPDAPGEVQVHIMNSVERPANPAPAQQPAGQ
jgi:hypothetical protein